MVAICGSTACSGDSVWESATASSTTEGTSTGESSTSVDPCEISAISESDGPELVGEWSAPVDWSVSAIESGIVCAEPPCDAGPGLLATHAVHLPVGKLLIWDGIENQYLWNIDNGDWEYVPAVYPRNGCAFDGLVDGETSQHCEEYCKLVGDANAKCVPSPDYACVMGDCALNGSVACIDSSDCEFYCEGSGSMTPECNPEPDLTCASTSDPAELFCSGHTLGPEGEVTFAGGNVTGSFNAQGKREIARYTAAGAWERIEGVFLDAFRWYPSVISLGDERILILGGEFQNFVEIFDPMQGTVTKFLNFPADLAVGFTDSESLLYPFVFQVEQGFVLYAGGEGLSHPAYYRGYIFDPRGILGWIPGFSAKGSLIAGGSAVMYRKGKVLKSGGCNGGGVRCQPSGRAEIIDVSSEAAATPESGFFEWFDTCPMLKPRHFHTLTVLPDGKVLATGGNSDGNGHSWSYCRVSGEMTLVRCNPANGDADCEEEEGVCEAYVNEEFATRGAELWDPSLGVNGKWLPMASQEKPRMYHSIALLLPDGRVLSAGGGKSGETLENQYSAEFFSPPYLFQGTRPVVSGVPSEAGLGSSFIVNLVGTESSDIERVTLIRLGSVTHQFDMDQRFHELDFWRVTDDSLRVFVPASEYVVPPGWYMVFVLDDGVPSVGEYIRIVK